MSATETPRGRGTTYEQAWQDAYGTVEAWERERHGTAAQAERERYLSAARVVAEQYRRPVAPLVARDPLLAP